MIDIIRTYVCKYVYAHRYIYTHILVFKSIKITLYLILKLAF